MTYHPLHVCAECLQRFDAHRGDGCCPSQSTFPKWPKTVKDESKANAIFDARIRRYWASNTTFRPRA